MLAHKAYHRNRGAKGTTESGIKTELVLTELCATNRLAGKNTRFTLVFHVEGLVSDRIFGVLKDFGRAARGRFRPLLACITPLCPMYNQDPRVDHLRLRVQGFQPNQAMMSDFASKVQDLSEYYDIGYHGHFFAPGRDGYVPSFRADSVRGQAESECAVLRDAGFEPRAYAGGWWFMTPWLAEKLEELNFTLDTTLNDVRRMYFSMAQPFPRMPTGEPFWIGERLLEVPSLRSSRNLLLEVLLARRALRNYVVLALHDYDLYEGQVNAWVRKAAQTLVREDRLLDSVELVDESTRWIRSARAR